MIVASQASYLSIALDEAEAATVTPETWVKTIKTKANYDYTKTHWWKALKALEAAAEAAPRPGPPTLQNTVFFAGVNQRSVEKFAALPAKWRAAFSADNGNYGDYGGVLPPWYVQIAGKDHPVDAWGVQTQIGADVIRAFQISYGLDRSIHQAETPDQAAAVTASYCIGNFTSEALSVQWARLNTLVLAGKLACTHEVYDGNPADDNTEGLPVSSFTLGVAMDAGVYYPLADLLGRTPAGARPGICVWHGSGLRDPDWAALASL